MVDVLQHLTGCKVFSTVTQKDDEKAWLEARTRGIGGSDIGAICGVSEYNTARNVYFKKTGQYTDSKFSEFSDEALERMRFGTLLEPIVANEYALRTGKKIISCPATLMSLKHDWAIANIDRFIVDDEGIPNGVLEVKTAGEYAKDSWEEGDLPLSYIYQLQWYMFVTGLSYGALACLVGGNKFYHYEVVRNNPLLNDFILPAAKHFWDYNIGELVEPELDGSDASTDIVNEISKDCIKGSEIIIQENEYNELALTVLQCKKQIKELENIETAAANRIKDKMKEHEIAYTSNYVIKWSPQSQKRIDTTSLKTCYPSVATECSKTISFRRFSVKGVD